MCAAHPRFLCRHSKEAFDQAGIESRGKSNRLWKAGRIYGCLTVQTFFVKDYGNTQTALFQKELLNCIGKLGCGARADPAGCVAVTPNLAQPVSFLEMLARLLQIELPFCVHQSVGLLLPDAHH